VLLLGWISFFCCPASANPPSKIECSYDFNSQRLTVTITHPVDNPATHYICLVSIVKNSSYYQNHTYTSQPTKDTFSYTYAITAKDGDVIDITATCILGGSRPAEVIVKKGETTTGLSAAVTPLWPVHAAFMTAGFILILAGTSTVYMKGNTWWFRAHKMIGSIGVIFSIIGLSVAIYMVSIGGGGHFRVLHAYLGAITLITILLSPILGVLWTRTKKPVIRTAHVWVCRSAILLMALTIIMGLITAGVL
jgi:hypothetical protein